MSELPVPEKANAGMSVEEMKMFVRDHFEDFVNKKQSNVAFRSFSHDFLDHDEDGGPVIGPQAAKDMMEAAYRKRPRRY